VGNVYAGVDIGKGHLHVVAVDSEGPRSLSRRVANDEPVLVELPTEVRALGHNVTWAVDITSSETTLLLTLLAEHAQTVLYVPGGTFSRAAAGYRGAGKTDAKDAYIIADQARLRRDLQPVKMDDELVAQLRVLTAHRADLNADRTRTKNRLRARLTAIFPGLERCLPFCTRRALVLLTGLQRPAAIPRAGAAEMEQWLRERNVRNTAKLAAQAYAVAQARRAPLWPRHSDPHR
jgi:Transposase